MTIEEIKHIPFHFVCSAAWEHEHTTCYISECGRFGICHHVPYKNGYPRGRSYTHYRIGDKIYKSKQKFIDALKEL